MITICSQNIALDNLDDKYNLFRWSSPLYQFYVKKKMLGPEKVASFLQLLLTLGERNGIFDSNIELDLANSACGDEDEAIQTLSTLVSHIPKLKLLNLSYNHLNINSFKLLAPALANNLKLENLNLMFNKDLNSECMTQLMPNIHSSLVKLCLAQCNIGDEGLQIIAAALPNLVNLSYLNVRDNNITVAGITALAEVAKEANLEDLNISGNNLSSASQAINTIINQSLKLKTLDVSYGHLDNTAMHDIGQVLGQNKIITWLSISGDDFNATGAKQFFTTIINNNTLERLDFYNSNLDWEGKKIITCFAFLKQKLHINYQECLNTLGSVIIDESEAFKHLLSSAFSISDAMSSATLAAFNDNYDNSLLDRELVGE